MSSIISVEDLNTYAGKQLSDGIAAQAVNAANQYVETVTHRVWGETRTVTNERYDLSTSLWLRQMDVVSVDGLTFGRPGTPQSTVDQSAWYYEGAGRINLLGYGASGGYGPGYVGVSYTYGVAEVPDDLVQATLAIAIGLYNYASAGGRDIVATSIDSYRVQYAGSVRSSGLGGAAPTSQNDLNMSVIKSYAKRHL
ncbi:hypothetical protein [Williamsia sterculiae]|uniref:Uncharacterized protein n=1 Tax=Williamsia sterculiae TaxID=1344003 RepID=A0A1N7GFW1_9NOCA|nr:hypothetical protein [Williamsia sterculiae]SIS11386.1 hypothetical protein SAMN05445060_2731 [Williamsia sterculiae]